MPEKQTQSFKPHEADILATSLEKSGARLKNFFSKGSYVVMAGSLVIFAVVAVYGVVAVTKYRKSVNPSSASAGLFGTNFRQLQANRTSWFGSGDSGTTSSTGSTGTTGYGGVNSNYPELCPRGATVVVPTTLNLGQTATISGPVGWRGGSFHSTNPQVVRVDGTIATAVGAGYAQIVGIDFLTDNSWPCSSDAVGVTVNAPAKPAAFINGYDWVGVCKSSAELFATSPVPAEIRFTELRNEQGQIPGYWKKNAPLVRQSDGTYAGSIVVDYSDFAGLQGVAAIFRLFDANSNQLASGYAAVSSVYDSQCN